MAIQVGTVDGLINITTEKIQCFTKGIEYFSRECIDIARINKISIGAAFQRLIEPVYKEETHLFDKNTISKPVYTNNGKEQSPSRMTYCKKMGLAKVDEINYKIELTELSKALLDRDITTEEYAFILLSKQGIFVDEVYQENLFVQIAKWFKENSFLTEDTLRTYLCHAFSDNTVIKSRLDIILNAFVFCGLLIKQNDKYFLADINAAKILETISLNASNITKSELDNSEFYSDYIGSFNYGVFDIVTNDNINIIKEKYPNILGYISLKNNSSPDTIRSSFIKFWSLTDQHGADYEEHVTAFENQLNPILSEECGISSVFEITDAAQYKDVLQRIVSKHTELEYLLEDTFPSGSEALPYFTNKKYSVFLQVLACTNGVTKKHRLCGDFSKESTDLFPYLTAIRTKPFILLAGISGTGKSRIVRKLAQATDTIGQYADDAARFACHKPGNFCLIQVKPNWHNSMDVVGYKSNIGKNGEHYEYTDFIDFIAKAWQHPDVPFFLCLDEMNLAPVEEYFAEFLSAIESRSIGANGEYETDPIIKPFKDFGDKVAIEMINHLLGTGYVDTGDFSPLAVRFYLKGMTLPRNLIVMGTVNMDETTFSFSRKVLDRAMSMEMNEVSYDDFLIGKTEDDIPLLTDYNSSLVDRPISAQEVKLALGKDAEKVISFLKAVNAVLEGTPFKLGYRAANEAMLYVSAAKDFGNDNLAASLDEFTLMKILSRIEGGDSKLKTMLGENLLDELQKLFSEGPLGTLASSKTLAKLDQMIKSLERDHFVSFWG